MKNGISVPFPAFPSVPFPATRETVESSIRTGCRETSEKWIENVITFYIEFSGCFRTDKCYMHLFGTYGLICKTI